MLDNCLEAATNDESFQLNIESFDNKIEEVNNTKKIC